MTTWSKLKPGVSDLPCTTVAHAWTDGCLKATVDMALSSCVGSAGFFFLMNFCQYLSLVLKKKKKGNISDVIKMTGKSVIFASTIGSGTIGLSCVFRNLLGKYYLFSVILIPAMFASFGVFLESRRGREIATNTFVNILLEFYLKSLEGNQILNWSANCQTLVFMITSCVLSTLLSITKYDLHYFWFFIPSKLDKSENSSCIHKGKCWKHILDVFIIYSTTGFVLQFVRTFASLFKNPKLLFSKIMTPKSFKLSAFLGSYVAIYEGIRCYLYQKRKKFCFWYDTIAGFLAGIAFRFQPTIPILNSGIITIIQIFTEWASRKNLIPNIPYLEIVFIFASALLFHLRLFYSDSCSSLMKYIFSFISNKRMDFISDNYKRILKNLV